MTFCVRLGPGAAREKIGGKARSLVRLAEAGLPVPRAIVVTTDLFAALRAGGPPLPSALTAPGALTTVEGAARALAAAAWPAGFATTLAREVDTLVPEPGARYAVRSSASIEDEARSAGGRVCFCRASMSPAARCWRRCARCWAPRCRPPPSPTSRSTACRPTTSDFAVLIHAFVDGDAAGAAAFDPTRAEPPTIEIHAGTATALEGARARPHRGGGARAGEDRRAGRDRMGRGRRRRHVPANAAAAIAERLPAARRSRSPSFDPLSRRRTAI